MEATRSFLVKRAQLLLQEIETSYHEIRLINNLLSDIHEETAACLTVPFVQPLQPQRPPLHKNLSSYRSESELRHHERVNAKPDPPPLHPAHRAAVDTQSKPGSPRVCLFKLTSPRGSFQTPVRQPLPSSHIWSAKAKYLNSVHTISLTKRNLIWNYF